MALVLAVGFTGLIWQDHAYGAWGDDSPGYTFLAGRLLQHKPLVYQDPVVSAGLDFFGNERDSRWLTPTHHDIISPSGWMASIYPIGLSFLMWLAAVLAQTDTALYVVVPICAGLSVGLTYLLGVVLLKENRFQIPVALASALALGSSQIFFESAVSEPMREIPSLVFLLLAGIAAVLTSRSEKITVWICLGWLLVGGFFGMATNVRETSIMVLPAIIPFLIPKARHQGFKWLIQATWKPLVTCIVGFLLVFSLSLWNSAEISQHKVKFRKKDLTSVAITSNIDHIQSLSLENIFNNQGKFHPGEGSLPHYWDEMRNITPVVFLFPAMLLGLWSLWSSNKRKFWFLLLWPLGTLTIFSLWVNPYSRYLLPAFPPLLILSFVGVSYFCSQLIPRLIKTKWLRWIFGLLVVISIVLPFGQVMQQELAELKTKDLLIYKSISLSDLNQLKDLGQAVSSPKSILLFTGDWEYGISETFELHTQVKSIRFPLENKRFDIPQDKVAQFMQKLLADGYSLYVWTDETTTSDTQVFLNNNFKRSLVKTYVSTYASQILVEQLAGK